MKKILFLYILLILSNSIYCQNHREFNRDANKAFKEQDYINATLYSIKSLQVKNNFKAAAKLFEKSIILANTNNISKINRLADQAVPYKDEQSAIQMKEIYTTYNRLNQIQRELKMTCSVGVSPNKLLSKIGSDFEKPDGLTVIKPDYISEFLSQLDIRNIPGIGKKTESILAESNCKKINDLLNMDVFELNSRFGRKTGTYIYNAARGIDLELVKEKQPSLQYSKITTLKENSKNYEFLSTNLLNLCKQIHDISIKNNKTFRTVSIQFVNEDLTIKTKSRTLKKSTNNLGELEKTSMQLLIDSLNEQELLVRRLGVRISELSDLEGQGDITSYF